MKRGLTGRYEVTTVGGEPIRAFVPRPLPPEPPLQLDGPLPVLQEQALLALGRLDALSTLLPDTHLFFYSYVRKEAVLSSQIEGTQSSLADLRAPRTGSAVRARVWRASSRRRPASWQTRCPTWNASSTTGPSRCRS